MPFDAPFMLGPFAVDAWAGSRPEPNALPGSVPLARPRDPRQVRAGGAAAGPILLRVTLGRIPSTAGPHDSGQRERGFQLLRLLPQALPGGVAGRAAARPSGCGWKPRPRAQPADHRHRPAGGTDRFSAASSRPISICLTRQASPAPRGSGQRKHLTRIDQVRVANLLPVGLEDDQVADAMAVGVAGDRPQVLAARDRDPAGRTANCSRVKARSSRVTTVPFGAT